MKLKRHLPKAPFPPTKAFKSEHFYVNSHGDIVYNDTSPLGNVKSIGQARTEQSDRNAHAHQVSRKQKRWAIIREMLMEGATYEELMDETGYKTRESIRAAIYRMRQAGEVLPDPKKGEI